MKKEGLPGVGRRARVYWASDSVGAYSVGAHSVGACSVGTYSVGARSVAAYSGRAIDLG